VRCLTAQRGHSDNSEKRVSTLGNDPRGETLKAQVYGILDKQHDLKSILLCKILHLNYKQNGEYIRKLRYLWKRDFKNGLGPKSPTSQHNARALCFVPGTVSRARALELGWRQSRNRNRVLVWRDQGYGRIEWWETRRCLVHVNKPQTMGRVKQFLSNVFFRSGLIFSVEVFNQFIDSVEWFGAHDVYDQGERVPYAVIDDYRERLGVVFRAGDLSHPDCYEIEWCKPAWAEKFEQLSRAAIQALEISSKMIDANSRSLGSSSQAIQEFTAFMKDFTAPRGPLVPGPGKDGVV
jgi:hypothetical protein